MKQLFLRVYHTLSEPRFKTGALVTVYTILTILGVDLLIQFGDRWADVVASTTLIVGGFCALISAWVGSGDWEAVALWLLLGGIGGTIVLEINMEPPPDPTPFWSISFAAFVVMLVFAIVRLVSIKKDQGTYTRYE